MILRDLEGSVDSKAITIVKQIEIELQAVNFDQSELSQLCLSSESKYTPRYRNA